MYYIVFILVPKEFIVIPEHWIRDIETQKKCLNNGLNRNQRHVCYWKNLGENGREALDFPPNFDAGFYINST